MYVDSGIVVPPRLADVVIAYTPYPGQTVGMSAGMSHSLTRNSNADAGDNGVLAASFGLTFGHSYDGPLGSIADTSIGLDFSYFRRTQRFEVTHEAPIVIAFDLRHRSLWTLAPRWQIGANVRLRRDDLGLQMPAAARSATGRAWTVDAEVGPRLQPSERVTLALSARFASTLWEVDGFDSPFAEGVVHVLGRLDGVPDGVFVSKAGDDDAPGLQSRRRGPPDRLGGGAHGFRGRPCRRPHRRRRR